MSDIVFMDTETLGIDINSPIWEFAAIRCDAQTGDEIARMHLFINHDPGHWLRELPESFAEDYRTRWPEAVAAARITQPFNAATRIADFLHDRPYVVGAVPNFDTERISHQLLRPCGLQDPWHYHLIDIENVIVGWVKGHFDAAGKSRRMPPPYSSDELSVMAGVDPTEYARHTAMGDARWVRAQWDAIMGDAR